MNISNGVNTKVTLQGSNHLSSVKRIKIEKERVENIIMPIQCVEDVNGYFIKFIKISRISAIYLIY